MRFDRTIAWLGFQPTILARVAGSFPCAGEKVIYYKRLYNVCTRKSMVLFITLRDLREYEPMPT